jgi:hypothetical protein
MKTTAELGVFLVAAFLVTFLFPIPLTEFRSEQLDPREEVLRFLQRSDAHQSVWLLQVTEAKVLQGDYLQVKADFISRQAIHPLDAGLLPVLEMHSLDLILDGDPIPLRQSPGEEPVRIPRVIYARDTHLDPMGGQVQENPWNYLTGQHLDPDHPPQELFYQGTTYHTFPQEGRPQPGDYPRPLLPVGAVNGWDVLMTTSTTSPLLVPTDGAFWAWCPSSNP